MDGSDTCGNTSPEVVIQIRQDRLQARAILSVPDGGDAGDLKRDDLMDQIGSAGVVYGIDTAAIDMLVQAWNSGREVSEPVVIAQGDPPVPAETGMPELTVPAISDPAALQSIRLRGGAHYQDLVECVGQPTPAPVDADQVVIRLEKIIDSRPGTAVDGSPLEPGPPKVSLDLGEGMRFDAESLTLVARRPGVLMFDGHHLDVLPVEYDGRVEVSISPDGLSCSVELAAEGPEGTPLTPELVSSALAAAGVKAGLVPGGVDKAVAEARECGRARAEVARGQAPEHGSDGRLEHFIDLDPTRVPLVEQGGRVDFKSISVIRSVSPGQPLVRRHPPTKGVPGFTVAGRTLPARDGRDVRLPRGRNVTPDPNDPDLLLAKAGGNIRAVRAGELEISEVFVVKGDVGYGTGHVKYDRSVVVRGDVKAGFNLDVGGNLEIAGLAEESTIRVGGDVLIRRGFVGQGHGTIEAKGSVLLGFGRNQKVSCDGALTVEREAINMTLISRDSVVVNGLLVGGRVSATNRIVCRVLGNASGTRTELEAGVNHDLLERRARAAEGVEKLRRLLAAGPTARQPVEELWQLAALGGLQPAAERRPMSAEELTSLLHTLEEKSRRWRDRAYDSTDSCVVVQDKAWPGAQIQISGSPVLKITDLLPGPLTFRLREGEVRWT